MTALWHGLVALLCFYFPGRAWLPYFLRDARSFPTGSSRLFLEVAFSAVASTFLGLLLLDVGAFSSRNLALLLALCATLGWLLGRGKYVPRYRSREFGPVLIFMLALAYLGAPMTPHLGGADGTAYLASAVATGRSGSLVQTDSSVLDLDLDLRRKMFPSVAADRGSPPYLRLDGGLVLRDLDSGQILPAFHHALLPWLALGHAWFGTEKLGWLVPLFAAGAAAAVFLLLLTTLPPVYAAVGSALLLVQAPFAFYARFPQPEVPAAFFLLAGLYTVAIAERGHPRFLLLGSAAFGATAAMRFEFLLLIPAALWWAWLTWPNRLRLVALLSTSGLCGAITLQAFIFRTHYWGNAEVFFREHGLVVTSLLAAGIFATCLRLRKTGDLARAWFGVLPAFALGAALLFTCVARPQPMVWLAEGSGWLLLGGIIGLAFLPLTPLPRTSEAGVPTIVVAIGALSFCLYAFAPSAASLPWWVVRRSAPALLPMLALATMLLVATLGQRKRAALVAAALLLALSLALPGNRALRTTTYFASGPLHALTLSHIVEPNCVVILSARLAPLGIALWYWAERNCAPYYLPTAACQSMSELLRQLGRHPVYVATAQDDQVCRSDQFELLPVGTYAFGLHNPLAEANSARSESVSGRGFQLYSVATYRARQIPQPASHSK